MGKIKSDLQKKYEKHYQHQLETVEPEQYKPKITFFTGAGISRESGLSTFRDSDGLWENHSIEEIATSSALRRNFEKVNNFYNKRRQEIIKAQPNEAHLLIKKIEDYFDVYIVTQNVDNLHERAGTEQVIHLHGEMMKSRSIANNKYVYEQTDDIEMGDRCIITNAQLRPHVVLFDELLDEDDFYTARRHIRESDILVVIGTSLQVNPAAGLVAEAVTQKEIYIIDPDDFASAYRHCFNHIQKPATEGMRDLLPILIERAKLLKDKFKADKADKGV